MFCEVMKKVFILFYFIINIIIITGSDHVFLYSNC